jgi:hypothetical protein
MSVANPFIYSTPDQIEDPSHAIDLFVDVFKDFYLVENVGNTFINGPRGSGKSMMFRIMKPDCQKVKLGKGLKELDYYAVYIPVKDKALDVEELSNLRHGENALNEHLLTTYFAIATFKCLEDEDYADYSDCRDSIVSFYRNSFVKLIKVAGYEERLIPVISSDEEISSIFRKIRQTLEDVQDSFLFYLTKLVLTPEDYKYDGALCLYKNFLFPLLKEIQQFKFLPPNKPIYLLVDDANWLNYTQTRILNSWVSYRTTSCVCFKITTQQDYKTFYTVSGRTKIDSPHDYHEINLLDIYTSNQTERYKDNVRKIVEKRLSKIAGINVSADQFFPSNEKQAGNIKALMKEQEAAENYDFAYRNANVDYMLSLANEYSYSYGGFDQLVHLSSGIIRNFIDLSFKMYDKTVRMSKTDSVPSCIPINYQDEEIREYANWFLKQLDKTINDEGLDSERIENFKRLRTLISSIGKAFRLFLESGGSERRKFSFYFDGNPEAELKQVLQLAISEGYFHYSTHGSKSGLGRSHKYVLNRMLSPIYKLDPFSFSGYLSLTIEKVELAMNDEKAFELYIRKRTKLEIEDSNTSQQKLDLL